MADYERLKGIRATTSAKQGDYLYSPRASGSIYGLVKYPDLIKVVSALPDLSGGVYDGYTFFVRVGSGKYRMYSVVGSTATERKPAIDAIQEIGNVEAVQPTDGDILLWNEEEGLFVFSHGLGEAESDIVALELEIAKIKNGTTVVKKAECDDEGDIIKNTYVGLVEVDYNDVTNTINVEARTKDGTYLGDDQITLPKATHSKDGLMAKEDKVYVDGLPDVLDLKENKSEKGIANGYASLDGGAKVPSSQLPDSILGQLEYKGTFNPSSGYPVSPEKGWFYISVGNASISGADYKVGDWAVYNGASWDKVDNTDAVASVNGKLGAVVLYGTEIQVGNGDTWTVEQRIVNIYAELNNRYTKTQTYSSQEVEQRITDLLGLANLQDTAIEYETGNFVFPRGAVFPATLVSAYNWVFLRFITAGQEVRYNFFKPTEAITGNYMTVIIQKSPARYARIMRDNGNLKFDIVNDANTVQTDLACTMKMWGIKLDGITAEEVSYDNEGSTLKSTTVQGAIDEHDREIEELKYAPVVERTMGERFESTLGDFVPNDNGKPLLKEVNGMQLYAISLISGDLVASSGTLTFLTVNSIKYYINDGTNTLIIVGDGNNYTLTNGSAVSKRMYAYNISVLIANKQYSPLYNTTFDLMSDAQIKAQINAWVQDGVLPNANLQAITNTKVKTIGKNLSPTNTLSSGGLDATTGLPNDASTNGRTNFILLKPSTQYTFTFGANTLDGVYVYYYDNNQNYLYRETPVYAGRIITFTTPANCYKIRGQAYKIGGTPNTFVTYLQLEQGSTATAYAPYKSGTIELTHTPLYRLPNGVKDIVRYDNGQYVKDKYVGELVLDATIVNSPFTSLFTSGDTFCYLVLPEISIGAVKQVDNARDYNTYMLGRYETSSASAAQNTYYTSENFSLRISFPVGTTLEQAKTQTIGTKIYYQLATPLLATELVNADGQLIQENPTTLIQEQTLNTEYDIDFTIDTKNQVVTNMTNVALKADKTYVDSQDALKAPIASPSFTGKVDITRTEADGTTALKVEKSNGSATGNIAEYYFNGAKVGQIDKNGTFAGGVEQTVANKNKFLPLLSRISDGGVIARFSTATWNGSAWVTDNASFGFGYYSLFNNTGPNSNGFGNYSLFNNTGGRSNGFGVGSLQNNTGIDSGGFGYASLYNNIGAYSNGFGQASLNNNTGAYSNGFGNASLRFNQKANNTAVGHNAYGDVFLINTAGSKTFDYTAINTTLERATIVSHSFGATNEVVNLKYTATSGTAIGGISINEIFQVKIIDADTVEFVNGSQKRNITSQGTGTHTFTPQFAYTNTTSLGANTVPNKDNQVVLGDNAVDTIKMGGTFRTPASSSDTGVKGEWCYDANYIYVCTATNEWKRTAITTW